MRRFKIPKSPPFTIIAPDGVDLDRYKNLPDPKSARQNLQESRKDLNDLSPDNFTVGYTGHLYDGRGINLIIQLAVSLPDVNFLIVGGEPDQIQQLKEVVHSQAIENVFIPGFIPNADLPQFQAACEVLMMPYQNKVAASSGGDISRYLSPMKLFEYMACGRVILASDLPVLREILNSKNAILLPPGRFDNWTESIAAIKENPARWKQLAETARQQSRDFTWESRAEKILDNLEFG
jgi:glycosyltransferase involved in cell wall biosynthesis